MLGANVSIFAVYVGFENVPRATTLPWKGRVARLRRAGWGEPHGSRLRFTPARRAITAFTRVLTRYAAPTLPFQGRVTVLRGLRGNSGARSIVTTRLPQTELAPQKDGR